MSSNKRKGWRPCSISCVQYSGMTAFPRGFAPQRMPVSFATEQSTAFLPGNHREGDLMHIPHHLSQASETPTHHSRNAHILDVCSSAALPCSHLRHQTHYYTELTCTWTPKFLWAYLCSGYQPFYTDPVATELWVFILVFILGSSVGAPPVPVYHTPLLTVPDPRAVVLSWLYGHSKMPLSLANGVQARYSAKRAAFSHNFFSGR